MNVTVSGEWGETTMAWDELQELVAQSGVINIIEGGLILITGYNNEDIYLNIKQVLNEEN